MDIADTVKSTVSKITGDKDLTEKFKKDPTATVKSIVGDKVPSDAIDKITTAVKAKLEGDKAGGVIDSIKKLF